MKKIFTLTAAVFAFALSASATTPFKNLYVEAEIVPSEAGLIYLDSKNDEDRAVQKAVSDDYDTTVFLKGTFGENGDATQWTGNEGYQADASGNLGNYEANLIIEPAEGYEFVCVSNQIKEDGAYEPSICYQSHTGTGTADFKFSWEYAMSGEVQNLVNINSEAREVDGQSDGIGREGTFALDNWSETPDTKLYVIMRKVGETTPSFSAGATGINSVLRPVEDGRAYTISGQVATDATKGIIIKNGKKLIKK